MKTVYQRLLSVLLVMVMLLTWIPIEARADDEISDQTSISENTNVSSGEEPESGDTDAAEQTSENEDTEILPATSEDDRTPEDTDPVEQTSDTETPSETSEETQETEIVESEETIVDSDAVVVYSDVESAAAYVRTQAVARAESITIHVTSDLMSVLYSTDVEDIFFAHTGNPKEGDYLRANCNGYSCSGRIGSSGNIITYYFDFFDDADQEAAIDSKINSIIASFGLSENASDYDKIYAAYHWITTNVEYDYDELATHGTHPDAYSTYAAVIKNLAVCQGYSSLLYRLLLTMGVDCRIITSNSLNHAWNIAKIGNKYYYLDATFDAGVDSKKYNYFLRGSQDFTNHKNSDDNFASSSFAAAYPLAETKFTGHNIVIDKGIPATCTETGLTEGSHCSICGEILTAQTVIPALGHTEVTDKAVVSTCTETGLTEGSHCSACGVVFTAQEIIPALGHTAVTDAAVAPTCTETGLTAGSHCSVCGEILTAQETVSALGHTPAYHEPDAVSGGYWYCTVCNAMIGYQLNYVLNGGENSAENPDYCKIGEAITLQYPTQEGYLFDGWYLDADFTEYVPAPEVSMEVNSNLTFYAKWNPIIYSIAYNANGGSGKMSSESALPYDETLALRKCTFTKKGYTFTGWNTEKDGNGTSYEDLQSVSGLTAVNGQTVTLYAQWTLTDYTITYNLCGATVENSNPESYTVISANFTLQTLANDPVLGTFQGWYTDASFKTKAGTIKKGTTGDKTFYAKWSGTEYSITYVLGGDATNANPTSYTAMDTITLAAPVANDSRMGTFLGWYSDAAFKTKVTSIKKGSAGDRVLYAKWKSATYTVTYVLNGGTNAKTNPKSYSFTTAETAFRNPTRKGYTFLGWYDNAELTGEPITVYGGGLAENLTLYAAWEQDTYSITYMLRGGTNSSANPAEYTVSSAAIKLQNPTRTGYTFGGWYSDSSLKTKVTTIAKGSTGDRTLYAKWTQNSYTITFNGNGKTGGSMKTETVKYNAAAALLTNKYTRSGYTFIGWNTKADGTGAFYANCVSVMNLSSAAKGKVTLYAQWAANSYSISYELNGGTVDSKNPAVYSTGEALTITAPTREGYTFAGWYKDAKFKTKITYKAGMYGNLTMYAKWTANTYSVVFNGNGSTSGKMTNLKLTYGTSKALTANAFKRTGYVFAGWNTMPDGSGTAYTNKQAVASLTGTAGGTVTLYAQWVPAN